MAEQPAYFDSPALQAQIYRLYRDFFDMAEKRRRWSLRDDIPWDQCNPALNPAVADVVESFCAVELYLPDYVAKNLPLIRAKRGRAWFTANWGYEESKHSLALGDWLLPLGHAHRRADDRPRRRGLQARVEPARGKRSRHRLLLDDAGAGHLAELPQSARGGGQGRRPGASQAAGL